MKKILLYFSIVVFGVSFCSCDDYLDVNENPNAVSEENLTTSLVMPAAEMNLATSYGNFLRIIGGFLSQHFAHSFGTSNYLDYSQFQVSASRCSEFYSDMYQRVLNNLKLIQQKAEASEDWGTYFAAATLRTFTLQTLVDCFGEVPYSEMLDVSNTSPKYDDGKDIYEGAIAELDAALEKVSESDVVCTNFLFPSERADSWIKFANALKLKMYMRMANVMDVKDKVAALIEEDNFPDSDVAFQGCWLNKSGEMSPYYAEEFSSDWGSTQVNVIANLAIIGTMKTDDYTDPRLAAYFEKNGNGEYVGGLSGTNFATTNTFKSTYWCRPKASYDMPVYLITISEIEFFLAEYYARYGSADKAAEHYSAAVEASFATAGVDGASEYVAQYPYNQSKYAECIGIAKWVALAGTNDFEAWCEMRRLNYPEFGTVLGDDMYNKQDDSSFKPELYKAGTLYTPIDYFGEVGENKVLERLPYPLSSTTSNANSPEFPGYTEPVFWGK